MKKIALFMLLLASLGARGGGYELFFCDHLDSLGRCKGKSAEFKWPGDKMQITAVVKNKEQLKTTRLNIKVFFMKNDRVGEIAADLVSHVKSGWKSAAKKIYFFKPGYYKVEVYNANLVLLATSFITITDRDTGQP